MQEKVDCAGKVPHSVLLLPLLPPSGSWGGASSSSKFLWAKGGATPWTGRRVQRVVPSLQIGTDRPCDVI